MKKAALQRLFSLQQVINYLPAGAGATAGAAGAAGAAAGLASSFLPQADKATANIAANSSDFFIIISFKLKTIYIRFTAITGNCCRT